MPLQFHNKNKTFVTFTIWSKSQYIIYIQQVTGQGWSSCNVLCIFAVTAHHPRAQWVHISWFLTMAKFTSGKIIICLHSEAITSTFHLTFSKLTFLIDKVVQNFIIIKSFFFLLSHPQIKSSPGINMLNNALDVSSLVSKTCDVFLFHVLE